MSAHDAIRKREDARKPKPVVVKAKKAKPAPVEEPVLEPVEEPEWQAPQG